MDVTERGGVRWQSEHTKHEQRRNPREHRYAGTSRRREIHGGNGQQAPLTAGQPVGLGREERTPVPMWAANFPTPSRVTRMRLPVGDPTSHCCPHCAGLSVLPCPLLFLTAENSETSQNNSELSEGHHEWKVTAPVEENICVAASIAHRLSWSLGPFTELWSFPGQRAASSLKPESVSAWQSLFPPINGDSC